MSEHKLAVIIPAYKEKYLAQTLKSFAGQTSKEFRVIVGDDHSPYDLQTIVEEYRESLSIEYHRFENNLGGQSLTDHWQRCIELAGSTEWIWLFSDDDIVDQHCVASFFSAVEKTNGTYDLYRFNSKVVDDKSASLDQESDHPEIETAAEFLNRRLGGETLSFAVEYIVRLKVFNQKGGFVKFPLAWASDDATWITMSEDTAIYTIPGAYVSWRYSGDNISSVYASHRYQKREASRNYLKWIENWTDKKNITINREKLVVWYLKQLNVIGFAGHKQFYKSEIFWLAIRFGISPFRLISLHNRYK